MKKVYYVRFVDDAGYQDFCRVEAESEYTAVLKAKDHLIALDLPVWDYKDFESELLIEESEISCEEVYNSLDKQMKTYIDCAQNAYLCDWFSTAANWIDKAIFTVSTARSVGVITDHDFNNIYDSLVGYRNEIVNDDYDSAISCGYGS